MREVRRTFHVGRKGFTHPVVLRSTQAGYWRTNNAALFMNLGHTWLGQPGARYRIEKWAAPHTDRTFTSLQAALNDWARATAGEHEKKTAAQLDAEIAEALAGSPSSGSAHATRAGSGPSTALSSSERAVMAKIEQDGKLFHSVYTQSGRTHGTRLLNAIVSLRDKGLVKVEAHSGTDRRPFALPRNKHFVEYKVTMA